MNETVRRLLDQQGCLHRPAMTFASDANLYDDGTDALRSDPRNARSRGAF